MLITQRIEFECCYITNNTLNAHRYKVEASAEVRYDLDGHVVFDFREFKRILDAIVPDGTYIYNFSDAIDMPSISVAAILDKAQIPVLGYGFQITAESLCNQIAYDFERAIEVDKLPIVLKEIKLRENAESFVTWSR